jgi:hypothetical protein
MRRLPARLLALTVLLAFTACAGPGAEGLAPTPDGSGPRVVFDIDRKPLPEVPLPNNMATTLDRTSPTGRRLNVSLKATTLAERELRDKVDRMDGFGLFSPIMVSFDAPLDLENIRDRQAGHDFSDDVILVLNVTPGSPDFGKPVPLDVGNGSYPLGLEWPWQYWDHDAHADSPNVLLETHEEDVNSNGVLDPYEDLDFDGVLDHPNSWTGQPIQAITPDNLATVLGSDARPVDDLIPFYEKQTNTLFVWPLTPMRQGETYAVVLTRALVGEKVDGQPGQPVRSPFPYVNHLNQTAELEPLKQVLGGEGLGLKLEDVAFAWSFTTQTITADLQAIRAGLYGHGPLAWLAAQFPPDLEPKVMRDPKKGTEELPAQPYLLTTLAPDNIYTVFSQLGPLLGYPDEVITGLKEDTKNVHHWVMGTFTTPYFLKDQDGLATPMYPADDNESFEVDPVAGTAVVGPSQASFICSVPNETAQHRQPFPVVLYGHGYSGAPFEIFGFAGRFAAAGYAICGLDAAGHGLALPADDPQVDWNALVPTIAKALGLGNFLDAFLYGRIRDLDNDGVRSSFDNGGDFWSWDVFHMRDMVRQTVVDHMQFIRILRSLGTLEWQADADTASVKGKLMGDFDGDGVPDLGGAWDPATQEGNRYYPAWGQSMGAFVSQVLAATEATVSAATPVSGGAGLIHVGLRSTNPGVPEAVMMPLMGPFIVFHPLRDTGDTVEVALIINDQHREYCLPPSYAGVTDPAEAWDIVSHRDQDYCPQAPERPHYYRLLDTDQIKPGDTVVVRNLTNGEQVRAFRHPDGRGFRVSLAMDAPSAVEKRPLLGLKDGDRQAVPVGCAPGSWVVPVDQEGQPTGPAACDEPDPQRALLFGDALQIAVYDGWWDGQAAPKAVFNTFEATADQDGNPYGPVTYQGAIFPPGTPLVALATGLGRGRNTPEFRRLMAIASMVVEKADPAVYARHYLHGERLDFSYDAAAAPQANMIVYHSVGDPNVPGITSVALARAMGVVEVLPAAAGEPSTNDRLIATHIVEPVEAYWRYQSTGEHAFSIADWGQAAARFFNGGANAQDRLRMDPRWPDEFYPFLVTDPDRGMPCHADPDDLDNGTNEFGEPTPGGPVRATLETEWGTLALRFPYTNAIGAHGVEPSNPTRLFNINNFVENQIVTYMASDGKLLSDDPCLAAPEKDREACSFLPYPIPEAE